jgi:hypothetical protein
MNAVRHSTKFRYSDMLLYTIQRNTKALLDASKEVGLEVNPEKTKYMLGPLKAWQCLYIWEQHLQIKIVFMKRLRAD